MATNKYLNLEGLERVAEKVNQKLRIVSNIPFSPDKNDIIFYDGATENNFIQGCVYKYDVIKNYYCWTDNSNFYYTLSETPSEGDTVYTNSSGTDSGYTIEAYDDINNQVTINNEVFDRYSIGDIEILNWVLQDTSVILNGSNKTGDEANFYAPTASGEEGQILVSKGANTSPEWASLSPIGYSPSFLDDALVFVYGTLPEVEGNSLIFDLGD